MYSSIKRDKEYISRLLSFIQQYYGIKAVKLAPARRGFFGETWRLDASDTTYFLKLVYAVEHKDTYRRSFPVIQHLCDHGIDFISRIVKTKDGRLFTEFDGAILGVYDWIDGRLEESDATKIPEYQMLSKVYTVPTCGVDISCEDFSCNASDRFFEHWSILENEQLLALLEKNRKKIEHRAERLRHFAALSKANMTDFVITHGDAGGNLIVNDSDAGDGLIVGGNDAGGGLTFNGNRYFIVDWDLPILAPPERDAWVMCSKDWAREAFENALQQNGISHTLLTERLAYYCYYFFFYYLNAFLDASAEAETVKEYFDGWIEDSLRYCDLF